MRQVSWIGTALLVACGIALWLPIPGLSPFENVSTSVSVAVEPTMFILFIITELLSSNPSLKLIISLLLVWAGLGLSAKTATFPK